MQGIHDFIPTNLKVDYANILLSVGFDTLDIGSFVSPKAVPQMKDTGLLLDQLKTEHSSTRLLVIVANERGAMEAAAQTKVDYLGFPLSLSETFQRRNTNKSIDEAFNELSVIRSLSARSKKELIVYLSMGFGNPYGDPFEFDYIHDFIHRLVDLDIQIVSLADTVGLAGSSDIGSVLGELVSAYPTLEIGAHLHSTSDQAREKIKAVLTSGCKRIDGALGGFGGCPMALDELTGNIPTELIIEETNHRLDKTALRKAQQLSNEIFTNYH